MPNCATIVSEGRCRERLYMLTCAPQIVQLSNDFFRTYTEFGKDLREAIKSVEQINLARKAKLD